MEFLKGKRTIIMASIGALATILAALGMPGLAEGARGVAESAADGSLLDTVQAVAAFGALIFLRLKKD